MAPNKYRSLFTGIEIDTLLSQVKNKIDTSVIKNDYTGGAGFVASADTVKTLNDKVIQLNDPVYLKSLLTNIIKSGTTAAIGDKILVGEYDGSKANSAKVIVTCRTANGSAVEINEVIYGHSSAGSVIATVSNIGTNLFTTSVSILGNRIQLIATAVVANLVFNAERISSV